MWKLDENRASLETAQLNCQLDLAAPAKGITAVQVQANPKRTLRAIDAALMQLTLPRQESLLVDAYVRGNDLVATYAESADHPCRIQVYWRFEHERDCVGLQLIVSVQTSLLDATPSLTVTSRLPYPAHLVDAGTIIAPLPELDVCYAELADSSNVESTIVRDVAITNKLFPGSLEKGVIRRARILSCFLPAASAEQSARTLHQEFVRSAPPLTT